VDIQEQPRYLMESIDIIPDLIPEEYIFEDFHTCVEWIRTNVPAKNT
jgi:SulP family sulfate permease